MSGSSLTQLVHRLNFNKRYTQNERKMDRKDSKNEMKDNREREIEGQRQGKICIHD